MKNLSLPKALITLLLLQSAFCNTSFAQIDSNSSLMPEGGSSGSVGGTDDNIAITLPNPWNTGILYNLERTQTSALNNLADNQVETAIKIYERQLEAIVEMASVPEYQLSWTRKISERALRLAGRLESVIKTADDRMVLLNVYLTTFDSIKEFYTTLDVAYIIPYQQNIKNEEFKSKFNKSGLEAKLNEYVIKQAQWFAERFVRSDNNKTGITENYTAQIFLVALSSLCKGLSDDLLNDSVFGPNLYPHAFEETAGTLALIAQDIDQHLAGGPFYAGRDDRAITGAYGQFKKVITGLNAKQ